MYDDRYWFLCPGIAGFLQPVADANILTLQGRLHLEDLICQVDDRSGGVLVIIFWETTNAQAVASAILLQGIVVFPEQLGFALQGSDSGVRVC